MAFSTAITRTANSGRGLYGSGAVIITTGIRIPRAGIISKKSLRFLYFHTVDFILTVA